MHKFSNTSPIILGIIQMYDTVYNLQNEIGHPKFKKKKKKTHRAKNAPCL